MHRYTSPWLMVTLIGTGFAGTAMAQRPPAGQLTLGFSFTITPTYLAIIPHALAFALPREPFPYDPEQTKRLLAEAGYPQGFDAGDLTPFPRSLYVAEVVSSYLGTVGIRTQLRALARAVFAAAWRGKTLMGLGLDDSAILGNAATRFETYVLGSGLYAYGSAPNLDVLYQSRPWSVIRRL